MSKLERMMPVLSCIAAVAFAVFAGLYLTMQFVLIHEWWSSVNKW